MNGSFANPPAEISRDAISGKTPPGPSMVGSYPKSSVTASSPCTTPASSSAELAFCKQPNVFPERASAAHDGTPATKFCQSVSRCEALNSSAVAAEPDSNI